MAATLLSTEEEIIAECEASGRPFEDPHFPPVAESLGCNLPARWLRPRDVFGQAPQLFPVHRDGCAHVVLGAARLGNTYLLGALTAVSARPALVQRLFVSTRGAAWGVYTLQLWRHDEWVQVMVDSSLPCDPETGALLFARPRLEDGFWLALVEKAAAKLAGSYAALAGHNAPAMAGSPCGGQGAVPSFLDALRDLTGGIPVAFPARLPEMSWERLVALVDSGAPAALTRRGATADAPEAGELLRGLPYPLLRANAQRRLVCLGSPWTDPRHHHRPPDGDDVPFSGDGFWMSFDDLPLHFDEVLAAEAPHDPTANDARDGSRRRLFVHGAWPAAGSARPVAAFELRVAVPMCVTAVLSQRARQAAALLLVSASDAATLDAVAGRAPLPARLLAGHSLPPRAQREVVLPSEDVLRPGLYYLLAFRTPGAATTAPFCLQLEAECRRVGGGELGSGGAAREAWADSPELSQLSFSALQEDFLPPATAGGAFSIGGDAALDALLRQTAPAWPPPEDEGAVGAMLAALAAAPVRESSAARIQATVRGRRERGEMDEMRSLLGARADAAAVVLQAAVRAAPARREGADARRSATQARQSSVEAQAASELSELRRLGLFLSDQALKVQKVVRGNSARRLVGDARPAQPSADAAVLARLDRIEELLLRLSGGGRVVHRTDAQDEAAACTLQAHARGLGGRRRATGERERAAREVEARRIQAAVRGAGGRRTAREMRRREVGAGFFAVQPFDRYAFGLLGEGAEGARDEWRYVPRHAAKAAAAAAAQRCDGVQSVEPSIDATVAASRLQSLGAPGAGEADLQPIGYRSRVLELQRRQRAVVAGLPLRKPDRVARLIVEKDAALERLAEMHAAPAPDRLVAQRTLGEEMQRAFAAQREEYHAAMRELAAELSRQVRATRGARLRGGGC